MPILSTAYVAVMLVCSGGEGCATVPVKDAQLYVSKADCLIALPALPQLRKGKYKCESTTQVVRNPSLPSAKQSETMVAH